MMGDLPYTLNMARTWVQHNLNDGVLCPCCEQFAKRYKRKLNSGMARWLLELVLLTSRAMKKEKDVTGWIHVSEVAKSMAPGKSPVYRGGDHAKLRFWGLIEEHHNVPEGKRTSGYWRATGRGIMFVYEQDVITTHVILYNNEVEGFEGDKIDIVEALGKNFNYRELMAR